MNILAEIGDQVRRERRRCGLTQEALALRAGISRGYLSDVERGKRDLSVTVLFRLLAAICPPQQRGDGAPPSDHLEQEQLLLEIVRSQNRPSARFHHG